MWRIKYLIRFTLLISSFFFITCKGGDRLSTNVIRTTQDLTGKVETRSEQIEYPYCKDPLAYAPYEEDLDFFDVRYIRLNFHFMDRPERDLNFVEDSDRAKNFVRRWVDNANERIRKNFKMNLPEGNETPQLVPQYQYVVVGQEGVEGDDGLYWHYDEELFYFLNKGRNKNNYKRDVIKKYAVDSETVLNVFLITHHPDSIASKKYKQTTSGIALGTDIKIGSEWNKPDRSWNYGTVLNHEIGHVMSLRHSWISNDGCEDTPKHKNCYSNTGKAPCDGVISNNLMDYNHSQMALTPCQIGKVHQVIGDINSRQRKLVREDWCVYDETKKISINRDIEWDGSKDLNKDLIIEDGASLSINCRLSMAESAKIVVRPGGRLVLNGSVLHNACGHKWGGIEVESTKKKKGIIEYNGVVIIMDVLES